MIKKNYILFLWAIILLSACVPEKRLGRKFVENTPQNNFLVITPDIILKESIKPPQDSSIEEPTKRQKDSIAFMESDFIRYIPDSLFYNLYLPAFQKEVKKLGLNVSLNKPVDSFFNDSVDAYIFDLSQIQLQEFSEIVYDQETFDGRLYYQKHVLDGIHLDVWVEFQKANTDNKPMVLFNEITARDRVEGHFHRNQITGKVKYSYKTDELSLKEVKQMIRRAGKTHAQYLFDFLMNQYIRAALLKKDINPKYYMHYAPEKDELIYTGKERFIMQE